MTISKAGWHIAALCILAFGMPAITAMAAAPIPDKARTASLTSLHQEADFNAPPARVYQALTDEKIFAAMSGAPAKIGKGEGGTFSLFGGAIGGRNVEAVPGKRLVQAWRDNDWPPGIYSIIRFELSPRGTGTHVSFDQAGFPAGQFFSLDPGWHDHYWEPMKAYLH